MTSDALFAEEAQNLGKRARTRARLMDAAVRLFARDGFEAASVNEIAKGAEVANGTFYVHFRDKDEIAAAVTYGVAREVVRQLNEAMTDVDDAVERVAMATRRFLDLASSQPDWGMALFRAIWTFRDLREGGLAFLKGDLQQGVDQGVFSAPLTDILVDTFVAMIMNVLHGRVVGDYDRDAGSTVAELQLRMLGAPAEAAHAAAWRPLSPLTLRLTPRLKGDEGPLGG